MSEAHTEFDSIDLKLQIGASPAATQTITIINQDELIFVHNYRFVWAGQQDTEWLKLDPPISQNCKDSLENCSAQGKYRVVGVIDQSLSDKKMQIGYRKSGGPLKTTESPIPPDKNPSHHYLRRGFDD